MTWTLLLKYWREALIVALVIALMAACHARDDRIAQRAVAQERARQADSVLTVVTPQLRHADTVLVHDTVRVRMAVDRVTMLHDTVLRHLTDTVLVKAYVTRADSAVQACTSLLNDCAAFRTYATQRMQALEAKAAAAGAVPAPSRTTPFVVGVLLGVAADYAAHKVIH